MAAEKHNAYDLFVNSFPANIIKCFNMRETGARMISINLIHVIFYYSIKSLLSKYYFMLEYFLMTYEMKSECIYINIQTVNYK